MSGVQVQAIQGNNLNVRKRARGPEIEIDDDQCTGSHWWISCGDLKLWLSVNMYKRPIELHPCPPQHILQRKHFVALRMFCSPLERNDFLATTFKLIVRGTLLTLCLFDPKISPFLSEKPELPPAGPVCPSPNIIDWIQKKYIPPHFLNSSVTFFQSRQPWPMMKMKYYLKGRGQLGSVAVWTRGEK